MGRRVLVTGGAGFIGSHVAAAYMAAGDEVTVLDDLSSGAIANLPAGARFVHADIRSREARALVTNGGFTLLNHHAAQVDVRRSVADPVRDGDVNVVGLLNLLEGARAGGVRRVIFASSGGALYVTDGPLPLGEGAPKLPLSPYGSAKLACEYYLATFAQLYGLESVVLRYSNVYGPRQNGTGEGGVVAVFAHRLVAGEPVTIFGDGRQTRDFVYVGDVAEANLLASGRRLGPLCELDSRAFNIGTGVETGVTELAELIAGALGRRLDASYVPARTGELRRSALAIDKAASGLGWRPRTTLREGVASTLLAIGRANGGGHGRAGAGAGSRRTQLEPETRSA